MTSNMKNSRPHGNQNKGNEGSGTRSEGDRRRTVVPEDISGLADVLRHAPGRERYTEEENQFIIDFLKDAKKHSREVAVPEILRALNEANVSPKERTAASLRAHMGALLRGPDELIGAGDQRRSNG